MASWAGTCLSPRGWGSRSSTKAAIRSAVCYFGEAAVNIGAFHEALNMAAVWKLPVIFLCENNRYGMGTAFERVARSPTSPSTRRATTWPPKKWTAWIPSPCTTPPTRAVARARADGAPTLLEVRTYRFMGHSMSDPLHGHYRTKEEVEEQKKRDPIMALVAPAQG